MSIVETPKSFVRFTLLPIATPESLTSTFAQIGKSCREAHANGAMVIVPGDVQVSLPYLRATIAGLSKAGCAGGFRLACVTPKMETFEQFVEAEDAGIRYGISARVFFDESNAARWLGFAQASLERAESFEKGGDAPT